MSKQNHVPKFGNWDANDHVPFTLVFEKARADKGTGTGNKIINPNDPSENPAAFGIKTDNAPPSQRPSQHQNPDDFGLRADSAGRGRPYANGSPLRPTMANHSKRGSHGGASDGEGAGFGEGDNRSAEQSPSHASPAFKGRLGNRPISSSLSLGSPEGGNPHHHPAQPARTRFRTGSRGQETPDRTSALPKFGAWDEKDPTSGEGFTVIFSHARNEKKVGGPARIPALQSESPARMDHGDEHKQPHYPIHRKASRWACCFHPRDAT